MRLTSSRPVCKNAHLTRRPFHVGRRVGSENPRGAEEGRPRRQRPHDGSPSEKGWRVHGPRGPAPSERVAVPKGKPRASARGAPRRPRRQGALPKGIVHLLRTFGKGSNHENREPPRGYPHRRTLHHPVDDACRWARAHAGCRRRRQCLGGGGIAILPQPLHRPGAPARGNRAKISRKPKKAQLLRPCWP